MTGYVRGGCGVNEFALFWAAGSVGYAPMMPSTMTARNNSAKYANE